MIRWVLSVAGLGLLFLLTGCGGGDDGNGGGGDSARSLMTLNSENSSTVASVTWGAVVSGNNLLFGDDVLPLQLADTGPEGSATVREMAVLHQVTRTTLGYVAQSQTDVPLGDPGDTVLLPQATETIPCAVSGSVVVSDTSATSGYVEFRDCTEFEQGVYVRLNGRVEVSNAQWSEGTCVDSFSGTVRFRDLSTSVYEDLGGSPLERAVINGSANVSEVEDFCEGTYSLRLDGQRLSLETLNESVGYFDFDMRGADVGSYWEDDILVTLDVGSLPGSVRVTTPQRLRSFWYDDYPHAGQVRLAASGGGYLLATINASSGPGAVSIVGDFSNDGVADCEAQVSWQQIVAGSWACGNP